jgi:SAM-dependent methyltransferase
MGIAQSLLMPMFGRSQGALRRLGGLTMARGNYDRGAWVIDLLEIRPNDRVLEVGFGSGVLIQRVAAAAACVAGADLSQEMVEQARARNAGVSTYAAAPWRVCRMILIPSMQRRQSIHFRFGRMRSLDCAKYTEL